MYFLLFIMGSLGIALEIRARKTAPACIMAMAPAFILTTLWGAFMLVRTLIFWAGGQWWSESPVAPDLAIMVNGITLSWTLTGLVIIVDKARNG